ncbi:TetR family transcriptional regulator C-terminal domain-containing protein [Streptomyces anulatus]
MGKRLTRYSTDTLAGLEGEAAVDALQALLEELLPLDDARRVESIVLTEFIVAARVNPIFRPVTEQMAADMRQVITQALDVLEVPEPAEEAERLIAILGDFRNLPAPTAVPAARPMSFLYSCGYGAV